MKVGELIETLSNYPPNAEIEFEIPEIVPKIRIKNEQIIIKRKTKIDKGKLVALLNAGWTYRAIADELKVSEGAIKNYVCKYGRDKR